MVAQVFHKLSVQCAIGEQIGALEMPMITCLGHMCTFLSHFSLEVSQLGHGMFTQVNKPYFGLCMELLIAVLGKGWQLTCQFKGSVYLVLLDYFSRLY